jgi:class 3 adenylate cyclase/DNA-binding beta-propeller fold protein YncE
VRRRSRDHVLSTVLFTDIVGSSHVTAELGDRRWRALLTRHHAIVRNALKRYRGRELDTAGDGFFAAFDEPSDAIRCACAISDGVRELGIEVRAGLNLGESEVIGGKLGGIAVHAGARIMALAGPGEVLVPSMIRDLVPGSGFTFEDRGSYELRDVPGAWRLLAVTSLDGRPREAALEPDVAAQRRSDIGPPPLLQRRGGRFLVGTTAMAVVAGSIIAILANRSSPQRPVAKPSDHVVEVDPTSDRAIGSIPVGEGPSSIAFGEGSVWVANSSDGTITRIDPATRRTITIHGAPDANAIAVGSGAVWVTSDANVLKIDPATNMIIDTIDASIPTSAKIAVDDQTGSVWVAFADAKPIPFGRHFTILRLDEGSHRFVKEFDGSCCYATTLIAGKGLVWFATDNGFLVRFDAQTGHRLGEWTYGGDQFIASGMSAETLWIGSASGPSGGPFGGGELIPVDLTTNRLGPAIAVGGSPSGIAILSGSVYVSDTNGGVESYSNGVVQPTIPTGGPAVGIAEGEGFIWVTVDVS